MCDTLVALGNSTADGSVILGKNSDREPNEAHQLLLVPAADHEAGSPLQCTYIQVPQAAHTHAVLLAKPFWIWGAEMGANEHGVVIGNEAVFTRVPYDEKPGLIGMDFIRLALERSQTAFESLQQMIALLETHGQGGNCGYQHQLFYHNSFLIADREEAWVFETAGRQWAAEKVKDVRSISNAITIGETWDMASKDLVQTALDKGWCKSKADFHFSRCYSDLVYTRLSDSRRRQSCTTTALQQNKGKITPAMVMALLRSHTHSGGRVDAPITGADVCMHAGYGPVRGSQSIGSMVSHLHQGGNTHWLTGTSAPCTGIFKPVWVEAGLPDMGPAPDGEYQQAALFWRHELLHREILRDFSNRLAILQPERDAMEADFMRRAQAVGPSVEDRRNLTAACFAEAALAEARWAEQARAAPIQHQPAFYYRSAWNTHNRKAKLEL